MFLIVFSFVEKLRKHALEIRELRQFWPYFRVLGRIVLEKTQTLKTFLEKGASGLPSCSAIQKWFEAGFRP